jgi:cytochrome bd ubiquinol oxidase subunit II
MPIDYEILRVIWWLLLGVVLIGFAITDGFDLGVATILHRVARTDSERRIVINTIGPTWESNQVWFILGGGAIFAAWPILYAVSFSGFYIAMFLVLLALILRPVGFKYRSKLQHPIWRKTWDFALFLGGFVPALIFGVALGNVLQGVPFHFDPDLRVFYTGSFLGLLNPFAILCGLVSVMMLVMHGGVFLAIKTEDIIRRRAICYVHLAVILLILFFIVAGLWIAFAIPGYHLTSPVPFDGPSNPLHKTVITQIGGWLSNYQQMPWTIIAPVIAIIGAIFAALLVNRKNSTPAFVMSSMSLFGVISTVGLSMFPFILPSSSMPDQSLLVWDASSSQLTLFTMLIAAVIFIPIILFYTSWVYRVLSGKVTDKTISQDDKTAY